MTPRERITAILDRQPVDRIPVDLWYTPEVGQALCEHVGVDEDLDMYRALRLDKIVWVFVGYKEEAEGKTSGSQVGAETAGERTMWGVPLREVQAGPARYHEYVQPPLTGYDTPESVRDYPFWPDPDRFDYEAAVDLAQRSSRDFAVIGPWVSLFEIYCQMRGLEQALMDVVDDPAYVDAVLDEIERRQTAMMERFFALAAGSIDLTFISDDMGTQRGLLLSPAIWERHFRRRMIRWCDLIHAHGIRVFFHTDGAAEPLIEPLLDCGIDVLNPIQHACPGMEMTELKRKYGERLIFHGGVDNQTVLPFGSVEDVRRETRECLETLGAGRRGFICCSCHNVQPDTPVENVLAMIETVQRCG